MKPADFDVEWPRMGPESGGLPSAPRIDRQRGGSREASRVKNVTCSLDAIENAPEARHFAALGLAPTLQREVVWVRMEKGLNGGGRQA